MELNQVKRMAADVFGVGVNKIRIKDNEKAVQAMTKDDVRSLIKQGAITKVPARGVSRFRAKKLAKQKKKGLRRGSGTRRGTLKSRAGKKKEWVRKIRALRRELKANRDKMDPLLYRKLYDMSKGGYFRSKAHLRTYIEERTKK